MSANEQSERAILTDDEGAQGRSEGRGVADDKEVTEQSSEASSTKSQTSKKFRIRGSKFFLTYPQCSTPKEWVVEQLPELFRDLEGYVVAEETHEDGQPHLHVYLSLKATRSISDPAYFDPIVDPPKHGNYQVVRSPYAVLKYCTKEGQYIAHGVDIRTKQRKRQERSKTEEYSRLIWDEGLAKDSVDVQFRAYRLLHGRQLDLEVAHQETLRIKRQRAASSLETAEVIPLTSHPANRALAKWLVDNIRKPREPRQAQLWIASEPGAGKTTLKDVILPALYPLLEIYQLPYDGSWDDDYEDGRYDLIIADEFKSQLTVQRLNQLADGSIIKLVRRGRNPVYKRDRLPMIVLSNMTPDEAYRKVAEDPLRKVSLQALKERFLVLKYGLGDKIRVWKEGSEPPVALIPPHVTKAGYIDSRGLAPEEGWPIQYYRDADEPLGWTDQEGPVPSIRPSNSNSYDLPSRYNTSAETV